MKKRARTFTTIILIALSTPSHSLECGLAEEWAGKAGKAKVLDQKVHYYNKAIENCDLPKYYYYMANTYLDDGKVNEPERNAKAESTIARGLKVDPFSGDLLALRGFMLHRDGNKKDAAELFEKAIEYGMDEIPGAFVYNKIGGYYYLEKSDYKKALELFRAGVAYRGRWSDLSAFHVAWTIGACGLPELCDEENIKEGLGLTKILVRKAKKDHHLYGYVHATRALVLARAGDFDDAKKHINIANDWLANKSLSNKKEKNDFRLTVERAKASIEKNGVWTEDR